VANLGYDGLTLVNGSLRQFFAGTDIERARDARVLGISASRNHLFGIGFFRAAGGVVRNSSGNGSITPDGGTGIYLIASDHVRVRGSSFRDNGDRGIGVFDSAHNLIKGNLLSRNNSAGITLDASDRNHVRRNRFVRDGDGIFVDNGNRNVIARNRFAHIIERPGRAPGQAIEVGFGNHNVIARNSVRNTDGHAISIGFIKVVGNVVRRNRIRGAGEDGVRIDNNAKHTRLKRNQVSGVKDDGVDVNSPKTKLTRNEARRNRELGIEAVRGVIDGGGNKASGNGDPRQCTHIVCN
jgi:parallel beta-helix repeat protein